MARNRYYLSIADLAHARGADARFAYSGAGPNDFARALQSALRTDALFVRWRAAQPIRTSWMAVWPRSTRPPA